MPSILASIVPGFGADGASSSWPILALDVAFLALCVLIAMYPNRLIGTHARPEIPAIKGALLLLGNTLWVLPVALGRDKLLSAMKREQDALPKGQIVFTATAPALGRRLLNINHPLYVLWAQKTNFENYVKGPDFMASLGDVLGSHGIFVADGSAWQKQRKMASHIFSVANFRTHVQSVVHGDLTTADKLLQNLVKGQQSVNLQDFFFRYTLSSFALMAFSAPLGCLPENPEGLNKVVDFADAFDKAQLVMDNRFIHPIGRLLEPILPQGRVMRDCKKRLNSFCYKVIDLRLEARRSGKAMGAADSKKGKDLLELFMDMGLKREELLPVVLNFLIAGRDTTAQSLSWTFYELYKNPHVVAKIREEVEGVLGSRDNFRLMDYDDMKSLPYLQAAFYEAIRLHPAVPKNCKRAIKDDVIRPYAQAGAEAFLKELPPSEHRLPDVRVKAGETVLWSDWIMARMPEIWGEDCCEYKPERFLETRDDGELSIKQYSPYHFHSFNAGPRLCLGQTLATFEGMAIIAQILARYDVVYDRDALEANPPEAADSLTHPIENPYSVKFALRSD